MELSSQDAPQQGPQYPPPPFPVVRSLLCPRALSKVVADAYDIGVVRSCTLLVRGLNDTYRVEAAEHTYVLRVSRAHWRSSADILYELDLLIHLRRQGAVVSTPLARKDHALTCSVEAPEGPRHLALFTCAPGQPAPLSIGSAAALGKALATIHTAADEYSSTHRRFTMDLDHLILEPLRRAEPSFAHRPEEWTYLVRLAQRLCERIAALADAGLNWGPCHGDATERNAHLADDDVVTLYDFDCGGPGWRAYDLATFLMEARKHPQADALWEAYLHGYTEQRSLGEGEHEAIPLFLAARYYWSIGLAATIEHEGIGAPLDDTYLNRMVAYLRQWEAERMAPRRRAEAPPTLYRGY